MMGPGEWNHTTALISIPQAEAIIAGISEHKEVTLLANEAIAAAKKLMGLFPAKAFNDAAVFAEGLAGLLSAHDRRYVARIMSPVDGLATRLKYAITLAEVKEALDAEKNKTLSILSVAKWTLSEHARREIEKQMYAGPPLTVEQIAARQRQVATLLRPATMKDDQSTGDA